jgi:hypothetical protein
MRSALRLLPLAVAVGLRDALTWGALAGGMALLVAAIARQAGGMK